MAGGKECKDEVNDIIEDEWSMNNGGKKTVDEFFRVSYSVAQIERKNVGDEPEREPEPEPEPEPGRRGRSATYAAGRLPRRGASRRAGDVEVEASSILFCARMSAYSDE